MAWETSWRGRPTAIRMIPGLAPPTVSRVRWPDPAIWRTQITRVWDDQPLWGGREGGGAAAYDGSTVASVGDVNGDGAVELIGWGEGQEEDRVGLTCVVYGGGL